MVPYLAEPRAGAWAWVRAGQSRLRAKALGRLVAVDLALGTIVAAGVTHARVANTGRFGNAFLALLGPDTFTKFPCIPLRRDTQRFESCLGDALQPFLGGLRCLKQALAMDVHTKTSMDNAGVPWHSTSAQPFRSFTKKRTITAVHLLPSRLL